MQIGEAVDTLLEMLRAARPVAVPITEIWLRMPGEPGVSLAHMAAGDLRRRGHTVTPVLVERDGKNVWAWRLDYDKEAGR